MPKHSSALLLRLNRKLILWPDDELQNDSEKTISFPRDFKMHIDSSKRKNVLYICKLTNHGGKDLVNIRLQFPISYHAINPIHATGSYNTKSHRCDYSVTFPVTHTEHLSWSKMSGGRKCLIEAFTEGNEIASQNRSIVISSIAAHETSSVYLVNASHYPVRFMLPTQGVARLSGDQDDKRVNFIRPEVRLLGPVHTKSTIFG